MEQDEKKKMMVLIHFDFWGDDDDLKKFDKANIDMAEKTEGMEYLGRFAPTNKKFHWTSFYKIKNFRTWEDAIENRSYERNKKHLSHAHVEFYR
jgi:hypothetical protein